VTFIGLNLKDADVFANIPDPSVYPAQQAQRTVADDGGRE